ncbi:MAG: dihydroorotate dehydrogenase-like protein [Actinomycetes bacterium]
MTQLTTHYLGLELKSPIVASPSPLTSELSTLLRLVEAGVGAVVLPSLFEEDVESESWSLHDRLEAGTGLTPEASNFLPDLDYGHLLADRHLRLVERACERLGVPVIASLNGNSAGGWVHYAQQLVAAGADAIELNMYDVAIDPKQTAAEVEGGYLALVREVRAAVDVPVALKVGPHFTSFANFALELVAAGADGLVLFNRFYQPDLDIETRDVTPRLTLSTSVDLRLPLRWIALLHPLLPETSLALTSGVHSGADVVKALLAGADVVMTTSALLREGPEYVSALTESLIAYLTEHEYESVAQLRGSAAHDAAADPRAYERSQYIKVLSSWPGGHGPH